MTPGPSRRLARPSDDRLAALAAAGDADATAALFARLEPELRRYCLGVLGRPEDAQDACQAAMERALVALRAQGPPQSIRAWLFRIGHNEAITLARRRGAAVELTHDLVAQGPAVEESLEAREQLNALLADLRALPERQRSALIMRELSGLTMAELAQALGSSQAAARQTLYEARLALTDLASGRDRACDAVRSAISDGDGRVARGRSMRAHLRACTDCAAFASAAGARRRSLRVLFPLPAGAAAAGGSLGAVGETAGRFARRVRENAGTIATAAAAVAAPVIAAAALTAGEGDPPPPREVTAAVPQAPASSTPAASGPARARARVASARAASPARTEVATTPTGATADRSAGTAPRPADPTPSTTPQPARAPVDAPAPPAPAPAEPREPETTPARPPAEPAASDEDCVTQLRALLAEAGVDAGKLAALPDLPIVLRCRQLGIELDDLTTIDLPDLPAIPVPRLPILQP